MKAIVPYHYSQGSLQQVMRQQGYIYLKNFFAPNLIKTVSKKIINLLNQNHVIETNKYSLSPLSPILKLGSDGYCHVLKEMMKIKELHELASLDKLKNLLSVLLGKKVYLHPRKMVRFAYPYKLNPKDLITPHQDFPYVGGEIDTFTVWCPLYNTHIDAGPIKVAHRSHLLGLVPTKPNSEGRFQCSATDMDCEKVDWRITSYDPTDVLIMHSFLVHAATPNNTNFFRLSCDFRFSDIQGDILADQLLPPYYPKLPNWTEILPNMPHLYSKPSSLSVEKKCSSQLTNKRSIFIKHHERSS